MIKIADFLRLKTLDVAQKNVDIAQSIVHEINVFQKTVNDISDFLDRVLKKNGKTGTIKEQELNDLVEADVGISLVINFHDDIEDDFQYKLQRTINQQFSTLLSKKYRIQVWDDDSRTLSIHIEKKLADFLPYPD